jgi:hypothetical protein
MRDLTRARPARFEPLDGKVGRLGTTQNPTDVIVSAPKSTLIGFKPRSRFCSYSVHVRPSIAAPPLS